MVNLKNKRIYTNCNVNKGVRLLFTNFIFYNNDRYAN